MFFIFIQLFVQHSVSKQLRPSEQTQLLAASDQGLHCLSMSHKMDARLLWNFEVNQRNVFCMKKF